MEETNEKVLPLWRVEEWFPYLKESQRDLLKRYFVELIRFNKKIALISRGSVENCDEVHFSDSILALGSIFNQGFLSPSAHSLPILWDIGSGNGLPGLIAAILRPDLRVFLLDSDQRKCEFLKHVASCLQLRNVVVVNKRLSDLPSESIDYAISRAFAPLDESLQHLRPILRFGARYFSLKGGEWTQEIARASQKNSSTWNIQKASSYTLPISQTEAHVVLAQRLQ